MSRLSRSIAVAAVALALGTTVTALATRAAADQGTPAAVGAAPPVAQRTPQPTSPPAGAPKTSQPSGAPQVPEESATIRDDPTIAPDPKQSADNNVSFPNDI